MSGQSDEHGGESDAACEELFYAHDSGWSVPRVCHRPTGHGGDHCGSTSMIAHIHRCTDSVTAPGQPEEDR